MAELPSGVAQRLLQRFDKRKQKSATVQPPRPRVAIVTDSAAALPPEWSRIHTNSGLLTVVTMPVILGERVYSDDDASLESHISLALATGTAVRTSRPSPTAFADAYKAAQLAGFDSVVSIHISAKLSGTCDAAQLAADEAELPVLVLDSLTVGMAQGAAVMAAVAESEKRHAIDQVIQAAWEAAQSSEVYFYVPSLEQLRKGGRISLASSWFGTVLDIKPILAVKDGSVVPLERVRSASKAIARLEAITIKRINEANGVSTRLSIHHFGNLAEAEALAASISSSCPDLPPIMLTRLPAVLAAHSGLGALVAVISD